MVVVVHSYCFVESNPSLPLPPTHVPVYAIWLQIQILTVTLFTLKIVNIVVILIYWWFWWCF